MAFHFGTLVLVVLGQTILGATTSNTNVYPTIDQALNRMNEIAHQWEGKFISRAVNLRVSKTFLDAFISVRTEDDNDTVLGHRLYAEMDRGEFNETGTANVFFDLPVAKIDVLVSIWMNMALITSEEAVYMGNIFPRTGFKTIIEHATLRDDGVIVYGITGFVEMATSHEESRRITVPYSFRTFRIPSVTEVTYERDSIDGACELQNRFCSSKFHLKGFSDDDSRRLFNFMRYETIKQFYHGTTQYCDFIAKLDGLYTSYLSPVHKEALKKIELDPSTSPSDFIPEYPFDMSSFLSGK